MIFVMVGTHYQGFERLIKCIDELAARKKIRDVVVQIGHSKYIPKNCKWFRFVDPNDIVNFCKKAGLVITHGGIGCIMVPLKLKKPVIVVPRYKRFGEHTNDHQLQITRELEREKRIIAVYDINNLERAIKKARYWKPIMKKKRSKILNLIEDFIKTSGG